MKVLKLNKSENQNNEINEDFFFNRDVLNKDELNQIKGGTTGGEEDDSDTDFLIDPV